MLLIRYRFFFFFIVFVLSFFFFQAEDGIRDLVRSRGLGDVYKRQVRHVASGVTASLAFIDAAIAAGADTLLVHHGLFLSLIHI